MSDRRTSELILVRHGQTDWNIARRYQGQTETDLNEHGYRQMKQAAARLNREQLGAVVASPLKRAVRSAEIVAEPHQLSVVQEEQLMELHLGSWQGQSYGLRDRHPGWFYAAPHGGEDGQRFCERIGHWLETASFDQLTVLVTHGLVIQVILMLITGESFDFWHNRPIKNGSITRLAKHENEWKIVLFNDDSHLIESNLIRKDKTDS